jgi:hypothetical protein
MPYRVVITDVTDYGDLHCVAGWDLSSERMVRPEPAPQSFWPGANVGPGQIFWPGHIVEFEGDLPRGQPLPHATEDVVVRRGTLQRVDRIGMADLASEIAGSVNADLETLFAENLVLNGSSAHVPAGSNCRSLGAIEIDRASLRFSETNWNGRRKLRGLIEGAEVGGAMNFGITATRYRAAFLSEGLAAASALLSANGRIHVRIGLSRPFAARPDECFVQINELYPLSEE